MRICLLFHPAAGGVMLPAKALPVMLPAGHYKRVPCDHCQTSQVKQLEQTK